MAVVTDTNAVEPRKSKMFWVSHEGVVYHVKGWDCSPANPRSWWIPELGYSHHEDYFFNCESDARTHAIQHCSDQMSIWKEKMARLM